MATCSYSSLLRENTTSCGSNWINPEDFQCVALRDCSKDVSSHLKSCSVADDRIESEIQLLLARAGMVLVFIIMPYLSISFGNATSIFSSLRFLQFCVIVPCLGVFIVEDFHSLLTVCPRHRETFGVGWRSGKVRCPIPSEIAGHKAASTKGDRGITSKESAFVLLTGKVFLPIGTRKNVKALQKLLPGSSWGWGWKVGRRVELVRGNERYLQEPVPWQNRSISSSLCR